MGTPVETDRSSGARFWAWWVLAHALVLALCLVIPCGVLALIAFIPGAQWAVLRRHLPGASYWPVATLLGMVVGAPLNGAALIDPNYADGTNAFLFALFPAIVGIAQWLALRAHVSGAGWWIAASAIGGALAWLAYHTTWLWANALYTDFPHRWLVARHVYYNSTASGDPSIASIATWLCQGMAGGTIYGAITGAALLWLLRHKSPHVGTAVAPIASS